MKDNKKTAKLLDSLRKEWPWPDFAFITEFRGGTGWGRESRADAIAMDLWPSRGLELIGFELKVSLTDLMHELKDLNKCEPMKQFCDRWYLVVGEEGLLWKYSNGQCVFDLIPKDWGIQFLSYTGKIETTREAQKLNPQPIDRLFLASLMRRASKDCNDVWIDGKKYVVSN